MRIVFILNNKYEKMTQNAINTVRRHNKTDICCLINKDVSAEFRANNDCIEYDSDSLSIFKNNPGYAHISIDAYAKLLIPKYFNEKVLYMDGDTICNGKLDELWDSEFENNYIVGCEGIDYSRRQAAELDIPFYINSGVMLMNCKLMNEESYFNIVQENWNELLDKPSVWSHDESIINGLFNNRIKLISEKFNYCYDRSYVGREIENPIILHFTGGDKSRMLKFCDWDV